ncbi:MAG: glycosyltransferase family 4 protein [Leptolyngbyaceae cyanobacterium CSU_1_4]|nr:glycosyltransferase family 4 protein [Leptolyngbyaceae cyanobacterium CSU_1_4]
MHWHVVAPFIDTVKNRNSQWLIPFVPDKNCRFTCVRRPSKEVNWHDRLVPVTSPQEWLSLWQQSREAVRNVEGGIITVFPQLAALVGIQKVFLRRRFPVVSWWFNTNYYTGYKRLLAKTALRSIDRFIVHNRVEQEAYSQWLSIPIERFEFVPLQTPIYPITEFEDTEQPFIVSVGSAYRDYSLLFEAIQKLGFRTIVISGSRALKGLTVPSYVETPFGLQKPEIISLLQRAKLVVLPMVEEGLVAGTVSIAEALGLGCPLIVSHRRGVEDYIQHGHNGLLVQPRALAPLTEAIDRLWQDDSLRDRLRKQSRQYALQNLTDVAAGAHLGRILNQVATEFNASSHPNYRATARTLP